MDVPPRHTDAQIHPHLHDASFPPWYSVLGPTPNDFLEYQSRDQSLWGSSVGASGQSPSYLAATHKNKVNEQKGQKRMKSMGDVHPLATLRRMDWIERG